ncbi:MAG: hypothetical protein GF334_05915, partial [Candidatus Altiarchaeales archaeon]|nr:hypothetical protein [Candidatus Altiarchaeales archaeon]
MNNGGYLYTALTVLLFLSLFSLVLYFYSERGLSSGQENIEHIKTKAIYDDIMFDLEKITNLTSFVNRTRVN